MSEAAAEADAGTAEVEGGAEVTETETEGTEAAEETIDSAAEELQRWKEESRKWEKRAKENSKAAARMKEIDQANMSELEKAQALQKEAEERADNATAMHNRVMAAAANDLPMEFIDFLGSGTEEEIGERAEIMAQAFDAEVERRVNERLGQAGRNGQPATGARPVESMRPGSAPAQGDTPVTQDDWFRRLLGNR